MLFFFPLSLVSGTRGATCRIQACDLPQVRRKQKAQTTNGEEMNVGKVGDGNPRDVYTFLQIGPNEEDDEGEGTPSPLRICDRKVNFRNVFDAVQICMGVCENFTRGLWHG